MANALSHILYVSRALPLLQEKVNALIADDRRDKEDLDDLEALANTINSVHDADSPYSLSSVQFASESAVIWYGCAAS